MYQRSGSLTGWIFPASGGRCFNRPNSTRSSSAALANNPTLEAAQAALRQANETVAAQRGSYYPSVSGSLAAQREKEPAAAFGLPAAWFGPLYLEQRER